jgi:hypothetical protein
MMRRADHVRSVFGANPEFFSPPNPDFRASEHCAQFCFSQIS